MQVEHYAMVARHIAARQLAAVRVLYFHLSMKGKLADFTLRHISQAANAEYNLAHQSFSMDNLLAATDRFDAYRRKK